MRPPVAHSRMSLQRNPAWGASGSVRLPEYQKRNRRWEPLRGRNLPVRQAEKRRALARIGASLLAIGCLTATLAGFTRTFQPAKKPAPQAVSPNMAKAVLPEPAASKRKPIRWKTVVATAYCPHCRVCDTTGTTFTGREAQPDGIAVARRGPRAARLGSKLLVPGRGWLLVDDVGGGVESNQIDIRVSSHEEAIHFGRRQIRVGVMETKPG